MNLHWLFPTLEFRPGGTVISRRRRRSDGLRNPNYGKVLRWRRHTKYGMEMLSAVNRFGVSTTIYRKALEEGSR